MFLKKPVGKTVVSKTKVSWNSGSLGTIVNTNQSLSCLFLH